MRSGVVLTTLFLEAVTCGAAWSQPRTSAAALHLQSGVTESPEISADPSARRMFWDLVQHARYGFSNMEQVAFIVRDHNGALDCVLWPSSGEPDSGRWEGAFPEGVVAIAHTHPNWLPIPSSLDARTATRTHTPVYVVTRTQIYMTAGGEPIALAKSDWKPATQSGRVPAPCRFL
jgi:hypothetical protein